jgi:hypothetical protein
MYQGNKRYFLDLSGVSLVSLKSLVEKKLHDKVKTPVTNQCGVISEPTAAAVQIM